MSKLFTATAVMQAVAAGRLDLDEPITSYLPEFTVHSAFQGHCCIWLEGAVGG
jgi:CubicO group peptidase (beta-lactamase class C family)